MDVLALFGPTAVGKTAVAIAVAEALRGRGEDPVAVSADAIQVYRGLETLSGAANRAERDRLEHRLLGSVGVDEEFSVGRFAELAHAEIDELLGAGRRPIVVGGTGLYLRAALTELELRPAVPARVRCEVEREIEERGGAALHRELPERLAREVHPNDVKRVSRLTELRRAGIEPLPAGEGLWAAPMRRPTVLVGLTMSRTHLDERIERRVESMLAGGVEEEVRRAHGAGAARTARKAIGFEELIAGDVEAMRRAQRRFARRQLTWMRRMEGVEVIDRTGLEDRAVADRIVRLLDREEGPAGEAP